MVIVTILLVGGGALSPSWQIEVREEEEVNRVSVHFGF